MKRILKNPTSHRQLQLALLGLTLMVSWLVMAPSAFAAAPTLPPDFTSTPTNPNTTTISNVFNYTAGAGEPNTVVSFQCRLDPGPSTTWSGCGVAPAGTVNYKNISNAAHTVEVRAVNTDGQGPAATYNWTTNVPAPTTGPDILTKPDDPNTTAPQTKFTFGPNAADTNLVNSYECRTPNAVNDNWNSCGSPFTTYTGNGDQTFQVRATNIAGAGPATEYNWNQAIPESVPDPLDVRKIASARWDGNGNNATLGTIAGPGTGATLTAGDIDGDGSNDLMLPSISYDTGQYLQILFHPQSIPTGTLNGLGPDDGYRIMLGANPNGSNIGDQNGDGTPDQVVSSVDGRVFVIYGVADPSSLPRCNSGAVDRCLDPTSMTADQGYEITDFAGFGPISASSAGDFDGDGIKDIAIGDSGVCAWIVKGGERTGPVSVSSLPATEALRIDGPAGRQFGSYLQPVADLNGDGKSEVAVLGGLFTGGGNYVVYGHGFSADNNPMDVADFTEDDGFFVATAPLGIATMTNVGDINGDGQDDLGVVYINLGAATAGNYSVVFLPQLPTADAILTGDDLEPGSGYTYDGAGAPLGVGQSIAPLPNFSNDGPSAQLVGAGATTVDGFPQAGAVYVTLPQDPTGDDIHFGFNTGFTQDDGVAIVDGKAQNGGNFGSSLENIGDLDGDGLDDFVISAPSENNNGVDTSGSVFLVYGNKIQSQAKTNAATDVTDKTASLQSTVQTNGRDSEVSFEYGATTDYGKTTDTQQLTGNPVADNVGADISGLTAKTTYHFRVAVTNALGLTRYGDDQTFTTSATGGGNTSDPCTVNPGAAGCADYCKDNSTAMGCPGYPYCTANPGKCTGGDTDAKLAFTVAPKSLKIKRGKKGSVSAIVTNAGGKTASGVKVCVKAPKTVKVKKCQNIGSLGSGATKTKAFKVTVKKSAKKGKKIKLKFTASGSGLGSRTASAKVAVR